jgi:hypothetical protein
MTSLSKPSSSTSTRPSRRAARQASERGTAEKRKNEYTLFPGIVFLGYKPREVVFSAAMNP